MWRCTGDRPGFVLGYLVKCSGAEAALWCPCAVGFFDGVLDVNSPVLSRNGNLHRRLAAGLLLGLSLEHLIM